jgi:hypothetical protein
MEHLLRTWRPERVGTCPDEDALAGIASGAGLPEERESVEGHLGTCDDCRRLVVALAGTEARRRGTSRRRLFAAPLVAAAVLLVGIGVFVVARAARAPEPDVEQSLESAARELAVADPQLFAAFRPLSAGERASAGSALQRGDLVLLHPSGTVLDPRPSFRWEPVSGIREWEVTLSKADGTRLWSAKTPEPRLEFPASEAALEPGARYLFEVAGEGPLGRSESGRTFGAAGEESRSAFARARDAIARRTPAPLRDLLVAHLALRGDHWLEAEAAARAYVLERPDEPVGRETLGLVLRLLGSSDA